MDIAGLALKVGRNTKMMIKGCRQMEKFGKSQPVKRVEDVRFLTGEGRYVDDIAPTDALHAYFFRSPVAHGVITTLDVTDAVEAEGVHAVLTIEDLEAAACANFYKPVGTIGKLFMRIETQAFEMACDQLLSQGPVDAPKLH